MTQETVRAKPTERTFDFLRNSELVLTFVACANVLELGLHARSALSSKSVLKFSHLKQLVCENERKQWVSTQFGLYSIQLEQIAYALLCSMTSPIFNSEASILYARIKRRGAGVAD